MSSSIEKAKGVKDILPPDEPYWDLVEEAAKKTARDFDFFRISTPILEKTELFLRGVGKRTDLVAKEMYSFRTKGDDALTLRPEGTAPVMRAYIENGMKSLAQPVKLFYFEPFFRHESPQHLRQRQFYQVGFEALGFGGSVIDAELIQAATHILRRVGVEGFEFQVNSLGDASCRPAYMKRLQEYVKDNKRSLCLDCEESMVRRPFNMFECQEEKCARVARMAPKMIDELCEPCHSHFRELLEMLDEIEVPYTLNPFIVRGLDYYTRTVFEIWLSLEGEPPGMRALGGGGRYDELAGELGGGEIPGSGFALGVERLIRVIKDQGLVPSQNKEREKSLFLAQLGFAARKRSLKLFSELMREGIRASAAFSRESLSSQLRIADKLGVEYALILGEKELFDKSIILRNMKTGNQEILEMRNLVAELKNRLSPFSTKVFRPF